MTNDPAHNRTPQTITRRPPVTKLSRVEARWEKPLIAASGGEATLLVRISPRADEIETSRAAPSTSRSSSTAPGRCRAANWTSPRRGGSGRGTAAGCRPRSAGRLRR